MDTETLKEAIRQELPHFLWTDPDLRAYILELTRREYAPREETQDRFYDTLAELRRNREEQTRQWEEQNRKWEEHQAEQHRKWEANQEELRRLHQEIMAQAQKSERGIGALGSRWGLQSEKAFRDALATKTREESGAVQAGAGGGTAVGGVSGDAGAGLWGRPQTAHPRRGLH